MTAFSNETSCADFFRTGLVRAIEFSCKWSRLLALKAAIRRGLQLADWTILIFFLRLSLPLQNLALF